MEDMQQAALPTKKHFEIMHGVLLIITLLTLLLTVSVAYFQQGSLITFERMAEYDISHHEALARIEALLKANQETIGAQPTASASSDVVVASFPQNNLRFVTAPGCEGVYSVSELPRNTQETYNARLTYGVFAPKDPDWGSKNPFLFFQIISSNELTSMERRLEQETDAIDLARATNASREIINDTGDYLVSLPPSDAPPYLQATSGGTCNIVAQRIPFISAPPPPLQ